MRKIAYTLAVSSLLMAGTAQAQESKPTVGVDVRVEPGVAVAVGAPQQDRFDVGGAIAVKPEVVIADIVGLGPMMQFIGYHSRLDNVDDPAILSVGGFVRLMRPHSYEKNSSEGAAAVSPWIDSDLQYVRTGPLNRFGYSVGFGAAFPLTEDRVVWMGPFLRYQAVHQDGGHIGYNTNDNHNIILGVSLEFDEAHAKPGKEKPPVQPEQPKPVPPPAPQPPAHVYKDVDMQLSQVIQFAWDSDKLDSTATHQLDAVIKKITDAKEFKAIKISGHASSEGPVKHNDILSQKRAESVLEYLAAHGISRDKLSAVGFGSRVPVATNKTEEGRIQNRRAEFEVNFVITKEVEQ